MAELAHRPTRSLRPTGTTGSQTLPDHGDSGLAGRTPEAVPQLLQSIHSVVGNEALSAILTGPARDAQDLYVRELLTVATETGLDVQGFLPWAADQSWMSYVAPVVDAIWLSEALAVGEAGEAGADAGATDAGVAVHAALAHERSDQGFAAGLQGLMQRAGGGRALTDAEQRFLTRVHGRPVPEARVHEGPGAAAAAAAVSARAFTVGTHIYAGKEGIGLHSPDAAELLAHESTHVVQAGEGAVPQTRGDGVEVSDPHAPHEQEAEALGRMGREIASTLVSGGLDPDLASDPTGRAIAGHLQSRFESAGLAGPELGMEAPEAGSDSAAEAATEAPTAQAAPADGMVSRDEQQPGEQRETEKKGDNEEKPAGIEAGTTPVDASGTSKPGHRGVITQGKGKEKTGAETGTTTGADTFKGDEGKAIADRWKNQGGYQVSDTGESKPTGAWLDWKGSANAWIKKQGTKLSVDEKKELADWLSQYEAHSVWSLRQTGNPPPNPGPVPERLLSATGKGATFLGQPPADAFEKVQKYEITMPDGTTKYTYKDHPVAGNYKYLKDNTGVAHGGKKLSDRKDLDQQFTNAGVTDPSQRSVLRAVSELEGGFEAVNTYDTGYVSVGMIQFTSGKDGKGSLADVLRKTKESDPGQFAGSFHDLGIDVDKNGIVVVDPESGEVKHGNDAVQTIMRDKRLTAVFQNAGLNSSAFQTAQMKTSVEKYYAADQSFKPIKMASVTVDGKPQYFYGDKAQAEAEAAAKKNGGTVQKMDPIGGQYGDVFQSEAGKAALMDRWVQRGSGSKQFNSSVLETLRSRQVTSAADLAKYERDLIPSMQNRMDVLKRKDLSQPAEVK